MVGQDNINWNVVQFEIEVMKFLNVMLVVEFNLMLIKQELVEVWCWFNVYYSCVQIFMVFNIYDGVCSCDNVG